MQNEKAVIATTQHFDNDGMMRTFTLNVKRATGEVESLNYAFRQVTDNNGNVTDTYFENTSSHLNDSGAIKQIDAIEKHSLIIQQRLLNSSQQMLKYLVVLIHH